MQDVRTLLLGKIKPGSINTYNHLFRYNCIDGNNPNEKISLNNFITLGNYDSIMVFKTSDYAKALKNDITQKEQDILFCFENEKRVLAEFYKDGYQMPNASSAFYHPIHIVRYDDIDEKIARTQSFWESQKDCFAVAFIYGIAEQESISDLERKIECRVKLPINSYLIYRSVNLSELVVVCKHNSLKDILDNIAAISYAYPKLQVHTVCGFRYDINTNGISSAYIKDDEIAMVKVSGTIRSHKIATDLFNSSMYKDSYGDKYIAFGNNDFNLIFPQVKTLDIIRVLNDWLKNHQKINEGFSTKKTRVHIIHNERLSIDSNYEVDKKVQKLIHKVQMTAYKCHELQPDHTEWVLPFVETLNMLSDMYNNPELSRIRYYTIDTLSVLNSALERINDEKRDIAQVYIESNEHFLNKFVSGFNMLIERIVRVDGYLSQEPGYSPLIYNMIPAGILEYYCSYINKATAVVNLFSNKKYVYSTLPLPELVRHISFQDILPHKDDPDCLTQVNLLSMPYNVLFRPDRLLFSATHEIMHFCGEDIRCRDERYSYFLDFMSEYLICEFGLDNIHDKAYFCIKRFFLENIMSNPRYFSTLIPDAKRVVQDLYDNVELKNILQNLVFEYYIKTQDKSSRYDVISNMNEVSAHMYLVDLIDDIEYLFKECYADLMTIMFLDIDGQKYCDLMDQMEIEINDRDEEERLMIDCTINLRKALVIYASGKTSEHIVNHIVCDLCDIFKKIDMGQIQEEDLDSLAFTVSKGDLDFSNLFYNTRCIKSLLDYLRMCSRKFVIERTKPTVSRAIDELHDYYLTGTTPDKLFSNEYCKNIYKVREELNEKLNTLK